MLIDYYKPTHQPTQQIYQLTYFLVNIYFCYCFFAYLFSCIVIFYVAYSFIYYGQLLLQTKTRLVSFCVWRNFMKRHILILAFCKHDDISFFVSVRLCMLADTVGSIS